MVDEILQPNAEAVRLTIMLNILPFQSPSTFTTFPMSVYWSRAYSDSLAMKDKVENNNKSEIHIDYQVVSSGTLKMEKLKSLTIHMSESEKTK